MKKTILFLAMSFLMALCNVDAQSIKVDLSLGNDDNLEEGPRTVNVCPSAYLSNCWFTIDYPMPTVSQVIIRDADTGAVVYSASYGATRQVIVDLSTLPEGTYELRLYAFGKWWWGEFELEE